MKKILYIDTWDKGYRNFTRIDEEIKKRTLETILVHTGSFHEKINYKEKVIDGLLVRDIKYYQTTLIRKVIEIEKPDCIIILNLSFIFDRAIVNICKHSNIKVIFLAHGKLVDPEIFEAEKKALNTQIWLRLNRIFSRKNLLVFTNYIDSQKNLNKVIKPITLLAKIVNSPSNFLTFPNYDAELNADKLLVYTQSDKNLYSQKFNFPVDKIFVIGNPEISTFINNPIKPRNGFVSSFLNKGYFDNYALYLDDGLSENKNWKIETWYLHLKEINELINSTNRQLVIKLHPRASINKHNEFFSKNKIIALQDADFKNLIFYSDFVISLFSSTIIYALILNKAVISPRWGATLEFSQNYPKTVVKYCYSMNEFSKSIEETKFNENMIKEYLEKNGINTTINSIIEIANEIVQPLTGQNN